jgi:hypothetical protein
MSRAYRVRVRELVRIQVRESARQTIRAEDHVGATLELLEILPREEMAGLLRDELRGRGFRDEGGSLARRDDGLTITVDPASGAVTVRAEHSEAIEVHGNRQLVVDADQSRPSRQEAERALRERLRTDLAAQAARRTGAVRKQATDLLEGALLDLRGELDQVVNRVTAEALKRKAAQLGRIKEMTEDPQAGSLTIVLEV